MELHAVYFKAAYRAQGEAQRHPDGLAILVHMFKVSWPTTCSTLSFVNIGSARGFSIVDEGGCEGLILL